MPNRPCAGDRHRQFDFWIGRWEVRDPDGALLGRNRVTPLFDGCALREEWRGVSGLHGSSLNVYVPSRDVWHQTWVDSAGNLLQLEGGLQDGIMVLEGMTADADAPDRAVRHRVSWSIVDGDADRVRQHWQVSTDAYLWETAFDGHYRRC